MSYNDHNDLRKGRFSEVGRPYFVTTVVNDRVPVFRDFAVARCVIAQMRRVQDEGLIDSLAWVLMPDHLHWLFELREPADLSGTMNLFKGRSARTLNKYLRRGGRFWQKSFHDHALRKEEDLQEIARYIVANPLRAGLVKRLGDYPHWDAVWL